MVELVGTLFGFAGQILSALIAAKMQTRNRTIMEQEIRAAVAQEIAKLRQEEGVNLAIIIDTVVNEVYSLAEATPSAEVRDRQILVRRYRRTIFQETQLTKALRQSRLHLSAAMSEEQMDDFQLTQRQSLDQETTDAREGTDENASRPLMFPPAAIVAARPKPRVARSEGVDVLIEEYKRRLADLMREDEVNSDGD